MRRLAAAGLALASLPGCFGLYVRGNVASPTALERQLLGEYEKLDRDLVLASSSRGPVGPGGPAPVFDRLKGEALAARSLQRFNEDDLAELKDGRCIAEALDATVRARPCPKVSGTDAESARTQRTLQRVIEEENRARRTILEWAAHALARQAGRPAPAPEELEQLRRTYHRLLAEAAKKGHLIEREPGVFREGGG